ERKVLYFTDSHFVCPVFRRGCDTKRCQISPWNASVCGVVWVALTTGMMAHASATCVVYPSSRPTMPRTPAPTCFACLSAATSRVRGVGRAAAHPEDAFPARTSSGDNDAWSKDRAK